MENKTSKYFKYAIGEIILVVIGILIALQINNWNELRKEKKLEQDYYCKLLEDVQQDYLQVNNQINNSKKRLEASNTILHMLQSDAPKLDSLMIASINSLSLITYTIRPNDAAFEDLKSSGNLNILKDNNIKTKVIDYYSFLEGIIDVMNINADGAVNVFFDKESYTEIGWHHISYIKDAIDTDKVDFSRLNPSNELSTELAEKWTSDAVFFIGANARIKYLYESILPEIDKMIELLKLKCTTSSND